MNQKKRKECSGLSLLLSALFFMLGVYGRSYAATPALPTATSTNLDRVAIDVNSERVLIEEGHTIDIVRGDLLTVIDAWSKDQSVKVDAVDLVGFAPLRAKNGRDDRGFIINTDSDLQPSFAKDKETEKSTFEIQARSGDKVLGAVFIHLIEPRLEKVEISVNGKMRQLHNGDTLQLRSTDKIAVKHVVTNIRGNENVHHELRSVTATKGKANKELIFARGDHVFGRIPLQWQE